MMYMNRVFVTAKYIQFIKLSCDQRASTVVKYHTPNAVTVDGCFCIVAIDSEHTKVQVLPGIYIRNFS